MGRLRPHRQSLELSTHLACHVVASLRLWKNIYRRKLPSIRISELLHDDGSPHFPVAHESCSNEDSKYLVDVERVRARPPLIGWDLAHQGRNRRPP